MYYTPRESHARFSHSHIHDSKKAYHTLVYLPESGIYVIPFSLAFRNRQANGRKKRLVMIMVMGRACCARAR